MNIVILSGTVEPIGREGKLETVFNDQGQPSIHFTLVHSREYTRKDGTKAEAKCFVRCRAFGSLCEQIEAAGGQQVIVTGRYDSEKVGDYWRPVITVQQVVLVGAQPAATATTNEATPEVNLQDIF